jgi:hypothetical protein
MTLAEVQAVLGRGELCVLYALTPKGREWSYIYGWPAETGEVGSAIYAWPGEGGDIWVNFSPQMRVKWAIHQPGHFLTASSRLSLDDLRAWLGW